MPFSITSSQSIVYSEVGESVDIDRNSSGAISITDDTEWTKILMLKEIANKLDQIAMRLK